MDTPEEKQLAAEIEQAVPGSDVTVEEIATPEGNEEIAVIQKEAEPPRDEMEIGYRYGQLEARMKALEEDNAGLRLQLAAFEQATVAAVETEAQELETQGEVIAAVAEEVLSPDHEAANTLNPEHHAHRPSVWERLLGGH